MSQLIYNDEEQRLIDGVHSVFPKVELDPEVAIGALDTNGENFYTNTMGCLEPWDMEAFFRGIDRNKLESLWKSDGSVWPAQHKPIPWWKIRFEDIRELRGCMDGMAWMSPYGKHYYLPFFILATLHDLSLNRQKLNTDFNECFVHLDLFDCLIPPYELKGRDCWEEVKHIGPIYKDPRFKTNLYGMEKSLRFLIFISFLNEEQIRLISKFMKFALKPEYRNTYADYIAEDIEEQVDRPKSCWSFS